LHGSVKLLTSLVNPRVNVVFEKYVWVPKSNVDVYNVIKTIDET